MNNVKGIVQQFKEKFGFEVYDQLPPFLRSLLSTDGTVTDLLEAYYSVGIEVEKVRAVYYKPGVRVVVLRHGVSKVPLLYAVTKFPNTGLELAHLFASTDKPIGRLIDEKKLSTRRIIKDISFTNPERPDFKHISKVLNLGTRDLFVERTYSIMTGDDELMEINEIFNVKCYE